MCSPHNNSTQVLREVKNSTSPHEELKKEMIKDLSSSTHHQRHFALPSTRNRPIASNMAGSIGIGPRRTGSTVALKPKENAAQLTSVFVIQQQNTNRVMRNNSHTSPDKATMNLTPTSAYAPIPLKNQNNASNCNSRKRGRRPSQKVDGKPQVNSIAKLDLSKEENTS